MIFSSLMFVHTGHTCESVIILLRSLAGMQEVTSSNLQWSPPFLLLESLFFSSHHIGVQSL